MFGKRRIDFLGPLLAIATLGLTPVAGNAATAGDISAAQVLNTSPMWADGGSYHSCNVVNVTTATIVVSIELLSVIGEVDASSSGVSLRPGQDVQLNDAGAGSASQFPGFARCRFTLNYGPGSIRANQTIFALLPSGALQTYAISEAR
jgi:hypothetical protein